MGTTTWRLGNPHPIVVARVLESRGGQLQTSVPHGTLFHESVEDAIRWLHAQGVRVVNMSINRNASADKGGPRDELTLVLDDLARELDTVIVLSAGNTTSRLSANHLLGRHVAHDYPAYLFGPDAGIAEPALAANALTVGGQARKDLCGWHGYAGIAPAGGPSPFTRTGVNTGSGRVKPDLVHWAGNWGWNDHLRQLASADPSLSVVVAASCMPLCLIGLTGSDPAAQAYLTAAWR
jgi:subtilisin family serine protease